MSGAKKFQIERMLGPAESSSDELLHAIVEKMLAELSHAIFAAGYEPQSGKLRVALEPHIRPGKQLPRSLWDRLLRRPVRYENVLTHQLQISALAVPAPLCGDL